jgi:hypothetical protein
MKQSAWLFDRSRRSFPSGRALPAAVSRLPVARLREMAIAAWEFARTHHSPAAVTRRYDEVLTDILSPPA